MEFIKERNYYTHQEVEKREVHVLAQGQSVFSGADKV
jgi:hypothetical protein